VPAFAHPLLEAVAPVLAAVGAGGLGRAVRVEDERLALFDRQVVLVVARPLKHPQGNAAALDEAGVALRVHQDGRVVAGVRVGERAVGRVEHAVEGRDELVVLD
jgi:hypothetical protein